MKVLVIGSGGREHAMCHAIAASPKCTKVYCAPGNAGIAQVAECWPIAVDKNASLVEAAKEHGIEFVIVGPEVPLALGLADELNAAGIPVFGPSALAAELESSKGFMKDVCTRAGVPTAKYKSFSNSEEARTYVAKQTPPIVVKADGLAAGKGVTIARTVEEAIAAVNDAMVEHVFGDSGTSVIIEDFMSGEEVSFFALADGNCVKFFATAQDHKAAHDGDKGPNTGGMGAYSPVPMIDDAMTKKIMAEIIEPTFEEMKAMGRPFVGMMFAGLMMTKGGPRVIEYNARFGDPEAEVMIPRLKTDLLELLYACSQGKLNDIAIEWKNQAALGVVMAADGYPGTYLKGSVIRDLDDAEAVSDVTIYHAATKMNADGEVTANGGRVLVVTALASTISKARDKAYEAVDLIDWPEGFCRRDIGWRALAKDKNV